MSGAGRGLEQHLDRVERIGQPEGALPLVEREAVRDGDVPGLERADCTERQADDDNGKSRQFRWRLMFRGH